MAKAVIKAKIGKKSKVDKREVVKSIKERLVSAKSIILSDYRGLNVEEISSLRESLKEKGIEFKVLKNTLVRIAAKEVGLDELENFLEGPTAFAFSYRDAVAAAKALNGFSREHEFLKIKGGVVEGKIVNATTVKRLAVLPGREELIAKLTGVLNAPINRLVYVLNAPLQKFVMVLKAIEEQKQSAA